jgi:NACalpha-BTF3-like transcription factor
MAEPQPRSVHEGATTGDVEDELQSTAKSAEDRKAASALASLDAAGNDDAAGREVDQEAVNKAMKSLGGAKPAPSAAATPAKNVKVDAADVNLLVDELELPKPKATELLKAHDGDAVKAMRAWIKA